MHHASATMNHAAGLAPPRAAYPNVPRVVERTDRRTRQLADAMVRLNGDDLRGCTDERLLHEGFSPYEIEHLKPAAAQIANGAFVRQDAVIAPEPPSDEMLVAEASALHDELFRRLVIKLRARPDFHEDRLAALWPKLRKHFSLRCASLPLPERLEPSPSVRVG